MVWRLGRGVARPVLAGRLITPSSLLLSLGSTSTDTSNSAVLE